MTWLSFVYVLASEFDAAVVLVLYEDRLLLLPDPPRYDLRSRLGVSISKTFHLICFCDLLLLVLLSNWDFLLVSCELLISLLLGPPD